MNKEKYQEIIDEAYKEYTDKYIGFDDVPIKEVFIHEIKTNPELSEKWGLRIKERVFTYSERYRMWFNNNFKTGMKYNEKDVPDFDNEYYESTPTKLITITYKNKTIQIYES